MAMGADGVLAYLALVGLLDPAFLFFYRYPRPIANIFPAAGHGVEQGGFAAIGIAHQSQLHRLAIFIIRWLLPWFAPRRVRISLAMAAGKGYCQPGSPFVAGLVRIRSMAQLAAGTLLMGLQGFLLLVPEGLRFVLVHKGDLQSVFPPQGQGITPQGDLDGVPHGRRLYDGDPGARGDPHIHDPPAHPRVACVYTIYIAAFPRA